LLLLLLLLLLSLLLLLLLLCLMPLHVLLQELLPLLEAAEVPRPALPLQCCYRPWPRCITPRSKRQRISLERKALAHQRCWARCRTVTATVIVGVRP
jgi:hypothetical protein